MRISELSRRAGVPLSALKYYQREGLLPPGARSAPNQTDYGDAHVRRLRLVRALLETGGLTVAAAKDVIAVLDAQDAPLTDTFRVAQHAMSASMSAASAPSDQSRHRVLSVARSHGWDVADDNPGVDTAARALDGLRDTGFDPPDAYLDAYATAAATTAAADVRALASRDERDEVAELMVVGTVLGDPLFAGLRRLAHQNATTTPASPTS